MWLIVADTLGESDLSSSYDTVHGWLTGGHRNTPIPSLRRVPFVSYRWWPP